MIKYIYILAVLYYLNLVLVNFVNLGIKNINLFNYKNTSQYSNNKVFFDILFSFYYKNNYFFKSTVVNLRENSLMVKLQSSKLLL